MSSSVSSSSSHNIIIDIPLEYLRSGKTLLIEKYSELYVDGCHISQPAHSIRHDHGLCLVDTQQEDQRTVNSIHQLENILDEKQVVQFIIEVCPQVLDAGKTITLEKSLTKDSSTNDEQKPSGNFDDLYDLTDLTNTTNIEIKIPRQCIQRGTTIVIQKENISVRKSSEYHKEQSHHLTENPFAKRDHLQSKHMIEVTIEIPPEILNDGQIITFRKEDPQTVADSFPYRHHSKCQSNQHQETNNDHSKTSIE